MGILIEDKKILFTNYTKIKEEYNLANANINSLQKTVSILKTSVKSVKEKCQHYMRSDNSYLKEAFIDVYGVVSHIK